MHPKRLPPDTPEEWVNRASSDLAIAKSDIEGAYLEDLCYHAQQAVEKSLKAILLSKKGSFPYTHSLSTLLDLAEQNGIFVSDSIKDSVGLTEFAVDGKYPGFNEPVSEKEWRQAVSKAEEVLNWAKSLI